MKIAISFGICIILFIAAVSSVYALPPKYHTYAGAITELQALAAAHPAICRLDSIGYSTRDSLIIYAFKISDNVAVEEDEPAILFTGGVHADEILGPEIVITFCHDILSKYDLGDTTVTRYINNYEIYVVPFVNPEGHVVVENGDTDWRKNKRDNNGNGILDLHDGVDNNRNYDFGWNIDTEIDATTPESLMYKGTAPFTEAENRSMAAFGQHFKPLVGVEYHSPTYGRSEKVYYNWYWYPTQGGRGMAPDEASMHNIGLGFAGAIVNDSGTGTYEARRGLVQQGDFKTYFYGNFGTAAFVCEVSDTTIQDTSLVDGICNRNLVGMYYLLQRSGYARLTGMVTDSLTGLPLEAEVIVQQATSVDIHPRLTRSNSGRYNRLIDPGTYTLVAQKTGYTTKTVSGVIVNNSGPTTTNVRLKPSVAPPGTPTLVSPANASTFNDSLALNFDWDNSSGATGYIIEIASDQNFTSYFQYDSTLTASNYRNTNSLHAGTFYWRVTARNGDVFSSRSSVWHFTIQITPPLPSTPTLLSPSNSSNFNDSLALNFDWSNSTNATGYVSEIATDAGFTNLFEVDSSLAVSNHRNSVPFAANTYYWRITAFNATGYSSRSSVWQYTIQMPPPAAPALITPIDGSSSTNAYLNFDWNDPSTAVRYMVQIDTDSLFSPALIADTTLTSSHYANIDSLANGRYFWRVKAANTHGWSPYSAIWYFDVDVQAQYVYIVGDANHSGSATGQDVTYLVRFFKGGPPPPLQINGFYPEADANGSCTVSGQDVTFLVRHFKLGVALIDGHCLR